MDDLLSAALLLLNDGCPADPSCHICRRQAEYDETACHRCWQAYLFDVANGHYRR